MAFINTLEVDPQDPQHKKKFEDDIENGSIINFIVLGNDANAIELVATADRLSNGHQGKIERKVAWIKDHKLLKDLCLQYLSTYPDYDNSNYDTTLAFTLSPKHHECKYVFANGDPIKDFNVSKAYWRASLRERDEA